jgi:hypothetical protein
MPLPNLPIGLTESSPDTHVDDHNIIHQRINDVPTFQAIFKFGDSSGVFGVQTGSYIWIPDRTIEVISVRGVLGTPSSSGSTIVDCNTVNLSTGVRTTIFAVQGDRPSIAASSRTAVFTFGSAVSVDGNVTGMSVDVDSVGTGARYLLVNILYRRSF